MTLRVIPGRLSKSPICDAIRLRRLLSLNYGEGQRIVEPYCHGSNVNGDELLRAYQLSGPTKRAHADGWRLFKIGDASGISLLDDSWASSMRSDFNPRDPDVTWVHCKVETV